MPAPLYLGRLWRPLLLGLKRRLGLKGRRLVMHPLWLRLQWGGGDESKEKASETGANCQDKKILEVPQEGNSYTWGGCSQCF